MDEHVVIGAAVILDGRLLVAKRIAPACAAGRWELPGDVMAPGEDEQAVVRRVFAVEFGMSLGLWSERILSDRLMSAWRADDGGSVPARLRALRCRLEHGATIDMAAGEPRPNRLAYEESRWVEFDRLGTVYPWFPEHDVLADEVVQLVHREWHLGHATGWFGGRI